MKYNKINILLEKKKKKITDLVKNLYSHTKFIISFSLSKIRIQESLWVERSIMAGIKKNYLHKNIK